MSSFGGTVKLTGESEYRKALSQITQSLRETSSALTLVDSQYSKNDNSITTVTAKNEKLNSILEKQKADYNSLKSSFDMINSKYTEQINSHNKLQAEYDQEKAKLDKLKNSVGENSNEYEKQKAKVGELATQLSKSQKNIDANEVAMSKLRVQMNNAEASINKTANEMNDLGKETKKTGDGFTVFKGILADLGSKAIQSAISGLKNLGNAVIQIGKDAISSYAEYEQLVGGVETLFKDSAKVVEGYANEAYKTAGLSANQYMETVTSFSASLLQSLGEDTKKAAEYSNRAVIDMSDNANKMGTSIEMIQNAYQGFAKQNYTMLDNLKLGYGGTKEEMERLINDASKLTDVQKELNLVVNEGDMSFGNIVNAISVVQKKMGIMGTTSKEASQTISGSVNAMKSAWQNLLTGIADDTQDMDKLVNNFVDSVITAGNNLVPRIKKSVEGIKKLINSLVKDVFPKLKKEVPELKPLIETFEWFIKNRNLVVNAVKLMVGAFAVAKIVQFTKALSDSVKGLIASATATKAVTVATNTDTASQVANTTAKVAGTGATSALTVATNLLNAAWKANPIGLVITGVTALIAVFGLLKDKSNEVTEEQKAQTEALKQQTDEINQAKDSWNSLKESQQNQINVGMTEISHLQALQDELAGLVDENGKVKDGYEARASFITSTLNEALGTEISMVDGVIQNYDSLKTTLDEVMEKKKAQIILDSQETLYSEAINGETEALKRLSEAESMLTQKQEERKTLEYELKIAQDKLTDAMHKTDDMSDALVKQYTKEVVEIQNKMSALDGETANIQSNYDTQKGLLEEYAYNIGLYEQNMAFAHAGEYEKMSTVNWEYVKDYQNANDAEKASLEAQVKTTEQQLAFLKELKDKSGSDLYNSQIAAAEKQLSNLKENLSKYNSTTQNGLNVVNKTWLDGLNTELKTISGKNIEFRDAGDGNVQFYEDGIAQGTPMAVQKADELSQKLLNEINVEGQAFNYGEYFSIGTGDGIESGSGYAYQKAESFGRRLLNKLKNALDERSPSKATKEMGQFLMEGLGIGMEAEENSVLKQASDFGKSLLSSLNTGLSGTIKTSAIGDLQASMSGVNIGSTNKNIEEIKADNYINVVEAFKDALGQMTIELDDENMGKFIDKTVAKTIYS